MLTDEQWRPVERHIPGSTARTGRPMADRRLMFEAALFMLTSGCPWRALPREFGRWQTAFHHFNRWRREGVFDRLARAMLARVDAAGLVDWSLFCLDGTSVRAAACAAGARRASPSGETRDHARGRSRGGFGTKIHLVACGNAVSLRVVLTAGQAHESGFVEALLDGVRVRRRRRPDAIACDKDYYVPRVRRVLRSRRIKAVIPEKQKPHGRRPGRPPVFDRAAYRRRNAVKRCVGWLKQCRRVATRYDKLAVNYLASVRLAMMRRYLKLLFSDRT
jgi:transposase